MGTFLSWLFYAIFNYLYYGLGVVALRYYTDDNHQLNVHEAERMLLIWPVAAWDLVKGFPADFAQFVVDFRERRSLPQSTGESSSES